MGHAPHKCFENMVILCFERRFSKQNSVFRLKSNILGPLQEFLASPKFSACYATGRYPLYKTPLENTNSIIVCKSLTSRAPLCDDSVFRRQIPFLFDCKLRLIQFFFHHLVRHFVQLMFHHFVRLIISCPHHFVLLIIKRDLYFLFHYLVESYQ